MHLLEVESYQL